MAAPEVRKKPDSGIERLEEVMAPGRGTSAYHTFFGTSRLTVFALWWQLPGRNLRSVSLVFFSSFRGASGESGPALKCESKHALTLGFIKCLENICVHPVGFGG